MAAILKIPFDKCVVEKSRRGAALAPEVIQKEAENIFLSEKGSIRRDEFVNVEISSDFNKLSSAIEKAVLENRGSKIVAIGGDNSVSYGLMKAFSRLHPDSCLLYFDAHFDAQDDFLPPTHEDVLRAAVKENFFRPQNILVAGVRNYTKEELQFVRENKIKYILAKDFSKEAVQKFAEPFRTAYLALDIDVIEPAFAPGTGWPEPLGLHPKDVLEVIEKLKSRIRLFDITEVCPAKDINNITSRLAAKFLAEFTSR